EIEGGEDGLVDLLGGPTADASAAVQENLEQADDAHVVDFDSRISDRADGDGERDALQEREVDVDVEPLCLEAGEAAGDGLKRLADLIEMVQAFPQTEVGEVVGAELVAQKRRELSAMLDLVDDGGELAAHPAVKASSEDRGNLVGGEPPQAEFAAALEQFVDGKVALEDEVAAILDLGDGIEAR